MGFHNPLDLMILPTNDRVPSGKQITAADVSLWRVAPASRRLYGGHLVRCFGSANMPARCGRYPINNLPNCRAGISCWPTSISLSRVFLLYFRPRILQRHGTVEDWLARSRFRINAEVAETLKLIA